MHGKYLADITMIRLFPINVGVNLAETFDKQLRNQSMWIIFKNI